MKAVIINWFQRYFSDPEAGYLFFFLFMGVLIVSTISNMLAPLFASIVIAYVLDWPVSWLEKLKCPHFLSVLIVFIVFIALVILIFLGVLPLLTKQLSNFVVETPKVAARLQTLLINIPNHVSFISPDQIQKFLAEAQLKMGHFGQMVLTKSLSIVPNIVAIVVYLVMVPLLVYFFMSDKKQIGAWVTEHFLPRRRKVLAKVWDEVHIQIGNYIRGKVLEATIVAVITYVSFLFLGLQYALLLGALVGLSVLIPYIGAIVVTIPVVLVGLLQWGWSHHFLYLMIIYGVIVALDANVLVPLLFSEAVSLHPIAIIVAVLIFGGIWGFWGIFFAIPLAALAKAVMMNWPKKNIPLK
jgi:putative permease